MGRGAGGGENRVKAAAGAAGSSTLFEISMDGARGVLFNIVGGQDLTMTEVDEAAKIISNAADPDANIIFGATIDDTMRDQIRITVVATGFDQAKQRLQQYVVEQPEPEVATSKAIVDDNNQPQQTLVDAQSKKDDNPEDDWDIPAFLRQRN